MNPLDVVLRLDQERYQPGEDLIGVFQISGEPPEDYGIELSVLWHTEGKGDEDLGVILFQEWSEGNQPFGFGTPQQFTVQLPRAPLTYDGQLIKVRWLAKVRIRSRRGGEQLSDAAFVLAPRARQAAVVESSDRESKE